MALQITLDLPETVQQQMEETAKIEQRSITDVIRDLVLQNWQTFPRLPDDVEAELAALPHLSNEALWLLARHTMSSGEQAEMALLNEKAKSGELTLVEERLSALTDHYDRTMVRRAQAAVILQQRGYNLQSPRFCSQHEWLVHHIYTAHIDRKSSTAAM